MKPITAVAVSGGVDSLVAARLLKERGPVVALYFNTGYHALSKEDIRRLAARLDMPIHVIDCAEFFRRRVVGYFVAAYRSGVTPNPCLVCNPVVKFGRILAAARRLGAERLATGHYARVVPGASGSGSDDRPRLVSGDPPRPGSDDPPRLLKGLDPKKDQSYFLAFLSARQLARACFPLGEWTKDQVREAARSMGISPVSATESQDVCFIRNISAGRFVAEFKSPSRHQSTIECRGALESISASAEGPIVDAEGRLLGCHGGLHLFTVGQRRGINLPAARPYYVIRLEPAANRLVVGFKEELDAPACRVRGLHWIGPPPAGPVRVTARIRYRHHGAPATLYPRPGREGVVVFDAPQSAVTPGQGAVFYEGDRVLGAGWIVGPASAEDSGS